MGGCKTSTLGEGRNLFCQIDITTSLKFQTAHDKKNNTVQTSTSTFGEDAYVALKKMEFRPYQHFERVLMRMKYSTSRNDKKTVVGKPAPRPTGIPKPSAGGIPIPPKEGRPVEKETECNHNKKETYCLSLSQGRNSEKGKKLKISLLQGRRKRIRVCP